MKKLLTIALVLVMVFSLANGALAENKLEKIKESGKITMATSPDFAPSEFIDPTKTGQDMYVGADIELAKYIAEKLGVALVIEAMDFSAVQGAVTTGKVDMGISGFAYTEERAESMGLSIYYNIDDDSEQQGLLVRTDEADQYKAAEDFAGKKIAAQNASLQYNLVSTHIESLKLEPISSLNDAIMMLITGKVDAVASAKDSGVAFAENYPEITMSEFYFAHFDEGNVLAVTKDQVELLEAINEILAEVNELGLYQQWKADATELAKSLGIE